MCGEWETWVESFVQMAIKVQFTEKNVRLHSSVLYVALAM